MATDLQLRALRARRRLCRRYEYHLSRHGPDGVYAAGFTQRGLDGDYAITSSGYGPTPEVAILAAAKAVRALERAERERGPR